MKRLIIISTIILCSSLALAQNTSSTRSSTWFGISANLHYFIPSIAVQMGIEDAFGENTDLRTAVGSIGSGIIVFSLNGSYDLTPTDTKSKSYIGFGPRAVIGNNDSRIGVGGLWGNESYLSQNISFYTETDASLLYSADVLDFPVIPILSITSGMNFYF